MKGFVFMGCRLGPGSHCGAPRGGTIPGSVACQRALKNMAAGGKWRDDTTTSTRPRLKSSTSQGRQSEDGIVLNEIIGYSIKSFVLSSPIQALNFEVWVRSLQLLPLHALNAVTYRSMYVNYTVIGRAFHLDGR